MCEVMSVERFKRDHNPFQVSEKGAFGAKIGTDRLCSSTMSAAAHSGMTKTRALRGIRQATMAGDRQSRLELDWCP